MMMVDQLVGFWVSVPYDRCVFWHSTKTSETPSTRQRKLMKTIKMSSAFL